MWKRISHSWASRSRSILFHCLGREAGVWKPVLSILISVMLLWIGKTKHWGRHLSPFRKTGCYCGSLCNQIENVWCLADASLDGFLFDHRKSYNNLRSPCCVVSFGTDVVILRYGSLHLGCSFVGMSFVEIYMKGQHHRWWLCDGLFVKKLRGEFKGVSGGLCVSIEAMVEDQSLSFKGVPRGSCV